MFRAAYIPRHRKPNRRAPRAALRAGVTGGVLSTAAAIGTTGFTTAAQQPAANVIEMAPPAPAHADEAGRVPHALRGAAADIALQAEQNAATRHAAKTAEQSKNEAIRKQAAAEKADKAEKAKREAAEQKAAAAQKAREQKAADAKAAAKTSAAASSKATEQPTPRQRPKQHTGKATAKSYGAHGGTAATPSAPSASAPASGSAASVIAFLRAQVGKPYVYGASGPSAYDCSGLTQAAFKTVGVNLPRTSQAQSSTGTSVSLSDIRPGDLLYWGGKGSAFHVGVYIGNGQYLDAANPRSGISVKSLSGYPASGAVRLI
ncbi:C40 family peptidase [Streptomyces monticola]|uniref:C40 family peptidase n=1 Tax=Streptomyces monticola TaxID=2666263 RepID=A0ABW2JEX3_9ACTN